MKDLDIVSRGHKSGVDITVIIPAYNIERYICRCLRSIERSLVVSKTQQQIVIVNDGSTDGTRKLIEAWMKTSLVKQIILINTKNKGLSHARNCGLSSALGDYVWFVDGDDRVTRDSLSTILSHIRLNKPDILKFRRLSLYPNNRIRQYKQSSASLLTYSKLEMFQLYMNGTIRSTVWDGVYKRNLAIQIPFIEGRIHEDHHFTPQALEKSSSLQIISSKLYYYRRDREGSIMNSYNINRVGIIRGTMELKSVLIRLGLFAELQKAWWKRFTRYSLECISMSRKRGPFILLFTVLAIVLSFFLDGWKL